MTKPDISPFLEQERQKTDASLNAERGKTNESLAKSRKNAELQTDKVVQGERHRADVAASESRQMADSDHNEIQAATTPLSKDKTSDDSRLIEERKRADDAIELERSQVDVAIDQERETKRDLANRVLDEERKRTDINLSDERSQTDSEVQRTSGLLHHEISEHKKTKVSLTTRDEFLAIVSHDLRNPIGTASMCAEMLLEDPSLKNLGAEVKKAIELIKRNVDTSLRLISDLLDMERIEEGKLQLKIEKHNLSEILSEAVESFDNASREKKVMLKVAAIDVSHEVNCDRDRILQVLSNLIGNALKFTPSGGTITVSAIFNQPEVQISVCDSGPGIPEEKQKQIFNRFAQLGHKDRSGLGLGLYISKMLVNEHRGKLGVQSKLHHGSTFHFTIPG